MSFDSGEFWLLSIIITALLTAVGWLSKEYGKNQVQAPIFELKGLFNKLNESLTKLLEFMARQDEKNNNTSSQLQLLWSKIDSVKLVTDDNMAKYADINHKLINLEDDIENIENQYQQNKIMLLRHDEKIDDLVNITKSIKEI